MKRNAGNTSQREPASPQTQTQTQAPHYKAGRVKVAVRVRPPFQDEIDAHNKTSHGRDFAAIIDTKMEPSAGDKGATVGKVMLKVSPGKQREFWFDHAFGASTSQDYVYDTLARPVVSDVLRGFNGTIFAYGQTGTGKTYTMGILETVRDEHAGIIPRAMSQIFDHVLQHQRDTEIIVTMSFLQLYRETIQDLLAPAASSGPASDDNLAIREDPSKGFYVEGLQCYMVRSYEEAEALLNLGLENRAIAPTLMNVTSSRSHTVLTINMEQRGATADSGSASQFSSKKMSHVRTMRSKLLLVDLAGSERVRKTVSKGTRLEEAKSINTSLSALGNVIAALAEANVAHVPYRDSKLTKILHDSLGGTASTALVAAIGPAQSNYAETLSTLVFASRCMAVKTTPVQHAEIDYPALCAQLQERLNDLEGDATRRLNEQAEHYEEIIANLRAQLDEKGPTERGTVVARPLNRKEVFGVTVQEGAIEQPRDSEETDPRSLNLVRVLDYLERDGAGDLDVSDDEILRRRRLTDMWATIFDSDAESTKSGGHSDVNQKSSKCLVALLSYSFELLHAMQTDALQVLGSNAEREQAHWDEMSREFAIEAEKDRAREREVDALTLADPLRASSKFNEIGNHLAALPRLEAITRVEGKYRSNNDSVRGGGDEETSVRMARAKTSIDKIFDLPASSVDAVKVDIPTSILDFDSPVDFVEACGTLHAAVQRNLGSISIFMERKDTHYKALKQELMSQMLEKRKREEEVLNWSYILKHLLASSAKLKDQLREERMLDARAGAHTAAHIKSLQPSRRKEYPDPSAPSSPSVIEQTADDAKAALFRVMQRTNVESPGGDAVETPATRLGARLAHTSSVLNHNRGVISNEEYDQIGPPPDSPPPPLDDVEFAVASGINRARSHSSSNRRPGEYSTLKSWAGSSLGNSSIADRDELLEDVEADIAYYEEASDWSITNSSIPTSSSMGLPRNPYKPPKRERNAPSDGGHQTRAVEHLLPQRSRSRSRDRPRPPPDDDYEPDVTAGTTVGGLPAQKSSFAKKIVANLGVDKEQERAAMEVITRVTNITPSQLAKLDEATRQQVLDMRRQLGVYGTSAPGPSQVSQHMPKQAQPAGSRYSDKPQAVAAHVEEDDDDDYSQLGN